MLKTLRLLPLLVMFGLQSSAQCSTPSLAQNIFLSATDTSISVYYDSTASANEYLGVISTTANLSSDPVNGTTYNVGGTIGGGTIVYKNSNYVFKIDGLTAGVHYYIHVYSVKKNCGTGQPFYSTNSLDGDIFTFGAGRGVPAGYYNGTAGLTCAPLKTALFNIIKPTVTNPNPTYKGILGASQLSDGRWNDTHTKFIVWDQYSDIPTGPEAYEFTFGSPYQDRGTLGNNEGERYNREHTFPQAWFGNSVEPMFSDMFIVYSSDKKMNGIRANFPYGSVGTATYTGANGTKLGNSNFPGYTGTVFEPINEYKGDLARANFYVVTAYEGDVASWQNNTAANAVLDGTSYPAYDAWYIKQLYQWHVQDPVSQKEIDRNNNVYMIQGARNPFIDHPEYVALIWQCTGLIPVTLIDFTANRYNEQVNLAWYATRETQFKSYEVERSTDGVHFYFIGSVKGENLANYHFTDNNLPNSKNVFYRLKMVDIDGKFNYSKTVTVRLFNAFSNAIVYPNPTEGNITLQLGTGLARNSQLTVVDVLGRTLLTQTVNANVRSIPVNVQALPAGRYFVRINNNDQLINESFVIVR